MKSKREVIVHFLIFILALSLMPVSGQARLRSIDSDMGAVPSRAVRHGLFLGKLLTRRNSKVLVNGNSAGTGATILSGTQIETAGGVRAAVQVAQMGGFDLSSNTIAVLEFNDRKLTGHLKKGCVRISTNEGVEGWITTPDGVSTRTDKTGQSVGTQKQICTGQIPLQEPEPEADGWSRRRPIWSWLLIAAGGYSVVASTLGLLGCDCCNPSPSTPVDSR